MSILNTFLKLVIVSLILTACSSEENLQDGYSLHGNIEGIKNGKVMLAKLDLVSNERVEVDSAVIRNGKFTFQGKVESPYLHTLFINGDEDKIHFFLENSEIKITGNLQDLEDAKVIGSREDSLFRSFDLDDILDRQLGMEIMLNYPGYCFAAFTAYYQFQMHNIHADTLDYILNVFTEPVRESVYYKHLGKLYQSIKKVAISQPAPNFSIPDTSGTRVELNQFKGSYVLIDFWASWCAPCRAANPKLVEIYNQFSDKNFTILGISVDRNGDSWKNAIRSDRLPWINVSNLNGWDTLTEIYGVKAVPQNFLLDPEGIIIDKNIEPEHLGNILEIILAE
jgi:peroxiredoxin